MTDPTLPPSPDSEPTSLPPTVETAISAPSPPSVLPTLPFWFPPLFYLLLAVLFLWRSTFTGEVFLPARMLGHVAPWSVHAGQETLPPWNPLRWDGIAQFYPWRHFAGETFRAGQIPLWNPYQFCGTPFAANSQSAILYPGNLLFYLLPTPQAFGVSTALHLTLCGWFAYLLLRRLKCADMAALLGGIVYAFSAWEIAWLQLPTFLATSCWFPLLFRQIAVAGDKNATGLRGLLPACSIGAVVGMILLAGHLQIAFYGLLAGTLWAIARLLTVWRAEQTAVRGLASCVGGLILGLMLAMPQMLPSLELSRVSHRASKPTAEGYAAYTEYALPPAGLAMLTLPDFFGSDTDDANPYWNFYIKHAPDGSTAAIRHNAAETAVFVGIVPLGLGILALLRALKHSENEPRNETLFWGGLAVLALLMGLGTLINALFYFRVPGFGQSGSPARALVLWALSWAMLAGFGLDTLLRRPPTRRETILVLTVLFFVFAGGLSMAAQQLSHPMAGFDILKVPSLGEVFARLGMGWLRLLVALAGCGFLLLPVARKTAFQRAVSGGALVWTLPLLIPIALLLTAGELFTAGMGVNPTAPPEAVYPETPGISLLREKLGHERIFPINQRWSLYKSPPAVLPPNAAMVYAMRDVQGYDSLLTGQFKAFANQFALPNRLGQIDASPPEVGNMVFFQNPNAPLVPRLATPFAVTTASPTLPIAPGAMPPGSPMYIAENELAIFALANARPRADLRFPTSPDTTAPPITWKEDSANRVTLEMDSPQAGVLNLADQFYPGWKATVDDVPAPVSRQTDAPIFRAVAVPSGHHVVALRYEPTSFRVGLYLACFACFLMALVGMLARFALTPTSRTLDDSASHAMVQ